MLRLLGHRRGSRPRHVGDQTEDELKDFVKDRLTPTLEGCRPVKSPDRGSPP